MPERLTVDQEQSIDIVLNTAKRAFYQQANLRRLLSEVRLLRSELAESEKARKEAFADNQSLGDTLALTHKNLTDKLTERDSRIAALSEQLESDRTKFADIMTNLNRVLDSRFWLTDDEQYAQLRQDHDRLVEALQVISNLSSAKRNDIRAEGVLIEIRDRSNQALATPSAQQAAERIAAEQAKDAVIGATRKIPRVFMREKYPDLADALAAYDAAAKETK